VGERFLVGLGNPGPAYRYHWHNVGYRCVEALATGEWKDKRKSLWAQGPLTSLVLLKPQTYMNLSGDSVGLWMRQKGVLWVVHDDLDLPWGSLRIKIGGGDGGHRGLQSITTACGSLYGRIRIGIGRPPTETDVKDYVLSSVPEDKRDLLPVMFQYIRDHLDTWLSTPLDQARSLGSVRF